MKRLTQQGLASAREKQFCEQRGICPICQKNIGVGQEVFDHDHETGKMRAVLHRGCNALEGRIHNNCRRHGVSFDDLPNWLRGCADYLERPESDIYHPSYRTEEEKRLLRNARARKKRKLK